ncbi:glycosyl hydrolase family 85 domain-containing protein [Ditylenchus destructor]|nr:glycosyl hydrolase family 85 domain-containing protein [Ditylenchus destructor]
MIPVVFDDHQVISVEKSIEEGIIYFDNHVQLFNFSTEAGWGHNTQIGLKNYSWDKNRPKTLLCHDMKGGYLPHDRISGASLDSKTLFYAFFHWWHIDVFVYFSHHFITVPPLVWINQAHLHGVPCLGTFITESTDGENICLDVFKSIENVDKLVEHMVKLCKNYGFDGWLINIENLVEKEHIGNLHYFLATLRSSLKEEIGSNAMVVWYDSVMRDGRLNWQNELNGKNSVWFDQVDAIFLNYTWTEDHLKRSVKNAKERLTDVYVGIDVFGRGCPGGGGWNCKEPLELIRQYSLSAAIFAPGWIKQLFLDQCLYENSYRFWDLLKTNLPPRRCITEGFATHFDSNIDENEKWACLKDPQLQPFYWDAESGCGLKLTPNGLTVLERGEQILFLCNIPLRKDSYHCTISTNGPLKLYILLSCETRFCFDVGPSNIDNSFVISPCAEHDHCKISRVSIEKFSEELVCITKFALI